MDHYKVPVSFIPELGIRTPRIGRDSPPSWNEVFDNRNESGFIPFAYRGAPDFLRSLVVNPKNLNIKIDPLLWIAFQKL